MKTLTFTPTRGIASGGIATPPAPVFDPQLFETLLLTFRRSAAIDRARANAAFVLRHILGVGKAVKP